MTVGLAESFDEHGVETMVGSARENAKSSECRPRASKTRLRGFYYRRAFPGDEVLECTVLREMSLTAREVLSHSALDTKVTKLVKQEQR